MPATLTPSRESVPAQTRPANAPTHSSEQGSSLPPRAAQKRPAPARPSRLATDDEILGLAPSAKENGRHPEESRCAERGTATTRNLSSGERIAEPDAEDGSLSRPQPGLGRDDDETQNAPPAAFDSDAEPENLRAVFDANPDLRRAWHDAQSYRETFATPEDARAATALISDFDRMDALFFSRRPEDHAELARAIAHLDPAAFASLAQAMNGLASGHNVGSSHASLNSAAVPRSEATRNPSSNGSHAKDDAQEGSLSRPQPGLARDDSASGPAGLTAAQADFFHSANAAAVQGVLDAIESQVERLLPDGVSKSARNRVVGEIYRELDASLRSNRQLAQQMRDAFRAGTLDAEHQRAIVSLVTGRARQALPGVAKRVLNEWTSTIVAANQDRRARQLAAERRVDIVGSSGAGNDGRRPITPRDIDYARLSDADILNL